MIYIQQQLIAKASAIHQAFQSVVQKLNCQLCGFRCTQIQLSCGRPVCYLCGARNGQSSGLPIGSLNVRVEQVIKAFEQSRFQKVIAEVRGMIRQRIKKLQDMETSIVNTILAGVSSFQISGLIGSLLESRLRAVRQSHRVQSWLPELAGTVLKVRNLIVQSSKNRTAEIQAMLTKLKGELKRVDEAFQEKPVFKLQKLKRVNLQFKDKSDEPIFIKGSSWDLVLRQLRKTNLVEYQIVTLCCTWTSKQIVGL